MELKISTNPQDYLECLKNMENRVSQIIENKSDELVWMLNHPTIYTSGSKKLGVLSLQTSGVGNENQTRSAHRPPAPPFL